MRAKPILVVVLLADRGHLGVGLDLARSSYAGEAARASGVADPTEEREPALFGAAFSRSTS